MSEKPDDEAKKMIDAAIEAAIEAAGGDEKRAMALVQEAIAKDERLRAAIEPLAFDAWIGALVLGLHMGLRGSAEEIVRAVEEMRRKPN
jgi:hypothetical protein